MPIIDAVLCANVLTVVVDAMIEMRPNEINNDTSARISGTPAATIRPNANTRITKVIGKAIFSARSRSWFVVSENAL